MIRQLLTAAAAMALFGAAPASAADYPPMPVPGPTKPFKVAAAETYRLPNGMQVTLIPYGKSRRPSSTCASMRVDSTPPPMKALRASMR